MMNLAGVTSQAAATIPPVSPSGIDPTGGLTGASGPSSEQFLRLLVLQLQHQDPLDPVKDQDFTAQLAQFSSLEQLTQINTNLLGLGGIQQGLVNAQALNLLGKSIIVSGSTPLRISGGHPDAILAETPAGTRTLKIHVKDGSGKTVRTIDVPPGVGRTAVAWDGTDDDGKALADGEYTLEAEATDAQGAAVTPSLFMMLTIDGVSFTDGGVKLASGGREVSFDQILEIKAN